MKKVVKAKKKSASKRPVSDHDSDFEDSPPDGVAADVSSASDVDASAPVRRSKRGGASSICTKKVSIRTEEVNLPLKRKNDKAKSMAINPESPAPKKQKVDADSKKKGKGIVITETVTKKKNPENLSSFEQVKTWQFFLPPHEWFSTKGTAHTNVDVSNDITRTLDGGPLLDRLRNSCFGHFLNMPIINVQVQLVLSLMMREVQSPRANELWFRVNDQFLRFSEREFCLISGLSCQGNPLKSYKSDAPNRLMERYFNGAVKVKKSELTKFFFSKRWDSDDDGLKIAALYFIHSFLFSTRSGGTNETLIDKEAFNLVESGDWETFPWGSKVYSALYKSIHHKFVGEKKASVYRYSGLPLVLQVWFYECCANADGVLAFKCADRIPRLLNWTVPLSLKTCNPTSSIFLLTDDKLKITNISPTEDELRNLKFPVEPEPDIEKDLVDAAKFLRLSKQSNAAVRNEMLDDLVSEVTRIGEEQRQLKTFVELSFTRVFDEIAQISSKLDALKGVDAAGPSGVAHEKMSDFSFGVDSPRRANDSPTAVNVGVSSQAFGSVDIIDPNLQTTQASNAGTAVNVGVGNTQSSQGSVFRTGEYVDDVLASVVADVADQSTQVADPGTRVDVVEAGRSVDIAHANTQSSEGTVSGHDVNVDEIIGTFPFCINLGPVGVNIRMNDQNEELADVNPNEEGVIYDDDIEAVENYPVGEAVDNYPVVEDEFSTPHKKQPVETDGSGSSSQIVKLKIFHMKQPFKINIGKAVNHRLTKDFASWLSEGALEDDEEDLIYPPHVNELPIPFYYGGYVVKQKLWFHYLNYGGKPLDPSHLDVILYYLRKRCKYDFKIRNKKLTTADSIFDHELNALYTVYRESSKQNVSSINRDHVIAKYILGSAIRCSQPWSKVDNVLFPVRIDADDHWILVRFCLPDWHLYVYDSDPSDEGYDPRVLECVYKYSALLPLFLLSVDFLSLRADVKPPADSTLTSPIPMTLVEDMHGVLADDFNLFLLAFAEYFMEGKVCPHELDVGLVRNRYAFYLWDYAMKKQAKDAVSDNEW